MRKFIDLTGQRFEKLIPIEYVGKGKWRCKCDCGNEKIISGGDLKSENTKSCGCLNKEVGIYKNCWTAEEINILKEFYPNKGVVYCSNLLNRKRNGIRDKAKELNLKIKFVASSGLPQKFIIKKLEKNKILSKCKIHGQTAHYYNKNKIQHCLKCRNITTSEYRKIPINNLVNRLRSSIRNAFKRINDKNGADRKIGALRHLDYTSKELYNYLSNIKKLQNNKCPICQKDYNKCIISIEHIVPVSKAKTEQQVIDLFALSNLSLMCKRCNSSKNNIDYNIWKDRLKWRS